MDMIADKDTMLTGNDPLLDQTINNGGSRVQQAAADKFNSAATFLRDKAATAPAVGRIAEPAARSLEHAANYVQGVNFDEVRGNVEDVVRRYPLHSLAAGVGFGLLIGRIFKR